jgi:hypothetical protein
LKDVDVSEPECGVVVVVVFSSENKESSRWFEKFDETDLGN